MVVTRSVARMEGQVKDNSQPQTMVDDEGKLKIVDIAMNTSLPGTSAGSMKVEEKKENSTENQETIIVAQPSIKSRSSKSRVSSSAASAQKRKLELDAAKEKARIQMELIDKQLAADLAAVEEKYSPHASECNSQDGGQDIEQWLERSQHELEKQEANGLVTNSLMFPPPDIDGTEGPVQQLVSALKDLVTTSASTSQNADLLSRMSTPRELPVFVGDPMEWLSFKNAYEESTALCKYSPKENLWRLRKCLRGPAKESVSALLISTTAPDIVMSTLELQFGNPETIISRILHEVKKLHPLSPEYYKDIVPFSIKIKNFVVSVHELKREEYLHGADVVNMLLAKLPTVLLSKWADYSYPLIADRKKAKLDLLSDFLSLEAVKTSTCSANLINIRWDNKVKYSANNSGYTQTVLLHSDNKEQSEMCRFCRVHKHKLMDCKKFKKSLRKDRWFFVKRAGLCYKCLLCNHDRQTCPAAACDVDGCGEPHHRLLHYVPAARQHNRDAGAVRARSSQVSTTPETETSAQSESVTHININNNSVLLKVLPINIHGPNGLFSVYALLDDGSTVSMMSAALARRAGLRGHKQSMRVRGAWDNTELLCECESFDLFISNKLGDKFNISLRSVNELNLPTQDLRLVKCENYTYLRELQDDLCRDCVKPEVLIGQDNYHLLLPQEIITGGLNEPCATRTPLGWCLHGRAPRLSSSAQVQHSALVASASDTGDAAGSDHDDDHDLRELHDEVQYYFSIESMGASASRPRQNSDDQRALNILEETSTLIDGRWQVGLPWKDSNCVMPDTLPMARTRLRSVEQKMKNEEYAARYHERIQHLIHNDYAKEVTNNEITPRTWYLPHFGVDNPNKKKMRLVFDAASKAYGLSLNDYLLKGPDLLMSLFGIMLRFRENKIAVTADIKDMFLRVKIRPEDQNALRFIFRGNPMKNYSTEMLKEPIKTYMMTSLIFGANCSPFIAQYVKNKNAQRFEKTMPEAVAAIQTQHYMDDYIHSLPDEQTAIQLTKDIMSIHSQAGFELRNWNSNSEKVLDSLPQDTLGTTAVRFKLGQQQDGERTLGLIWHTKDDTLRFDVSFKKISIDILNGNKIPTKREMLRVVMSIFDVYGFLSPVTINGKIILQETWRLKISWDETVNEEIYTKWFKWICLLKSLREVKLPRYYQTAAMSVSEMATYTYSPPPSNIEAVTTENSATVNATVVAQASTSETTARLMRTDTMTHAPSNNNTSGTGYSNLQMHIFCDASTKAICAVAYWRWLDNELNTRVAFIASKCRVAGNKPVTMPRLELQAAVLGARLADIITKEHGMTATSRVFWSDSTTVLHWLRNSSRNYNVFVANRLGELDELTLMSEWRYVPSKLNAADIATRENYDCAVLQNEWLHGPTFLLKCCDEWPLDIIKPENKEHELEYVSIVQTVIKNLPVPEPMKFSSWLRLLRSTARVLTFIDNGIKALYRKFENIKLTYDSNDDVMKRAENLIIRYSQAQSFGEEIELLKSGKSLSTSSKLLTLSPYLDGHGVLRAGGRIDAATDVLPEIKRPVILDGKNYISRLIVRHYHVNAAHGNQEMVVNELKQKYWVIKIRPTVKSVVKQCMLCRIRKCRPEIPRMGDLPESRMAHHRRPFTNCGIDLFGPMEVTVGRRREKRYGVLFTCLTVRAIHIETVSSLSTDALILALRRMAARRGWPYQIYSDNGTNLRGADNELKRSLLDLNDQAMISETAKHGTKWIFIPPASPHWGGAWERLIRSVKSSLQVVLKERAPRDETLNTLLAEVETIVNSRPLSHVSVEAGSTETLTPNHFLMGTSSGGPLLGKFNDSDLYLRKQWRIAQRLADMFWQRWLREVLPSLIPRQKWNREQRSLKVGDLVFIVDPNGPRNAWPRGLIHELCPGKDNRVRMVKIKVGGRIITRSVTRVARIPLDDDEC